MRDINDVLREIKPDKETEKKVNDIVNEFKEILENEGLNVFIGGSYGKGVWLKNDFDVDLFIIFEKEDKKISEILESYLKKLNLSYDKVKGSRDYFKLNYKGISFEIVPILKIDDPYEAKNVTDLSPFHVRYVKSKLDEKMADEVRLLKYFMKYYGLYGAESYVKGFSGYAVELLIIYHGSFRKFLEESSNWRPKVVIDIEKYYSNFKEILENMGKDKVKSPIIIVDPVNKFRNATASVSFNTFTKTIFYSRLFLEKGYFFDWKYNENEILEKARKYDTLCIKVVLEGKDINKDIKNTKALKFLDMLKRQIILAGFRIFNSYDYFEGDKLISYIMIYPHRLPRYEIREGPLLWDKENFDRFYSKYKDEEIFVKNGRIYSIAERNIDSMEKFIENFKKRFKDNIKNKLSSFDIKILYG